MNSIATEHETANPDALVEAYGERHTNRALDAMLADMAAPRGVGFADPTPDDVRRPVDNGPDREDWHESGAEMEALKDHLAKLGDKLTAELPDGSFANIERVTSYRPHMRYSPKFSDGWTCTIYAGARYADRTWAGTADNPEAAVDAALAKYHAQAQGEELDSLCESDA